MVKVKVKSFGWWEFAAAPAIFRVSIFMDLSGLIKVLWLRSVELIHVCKIQTPVQHILLIGAGHRDIRVADASADSLQSRASVRLPLSYSQGYLRQWGTWSTSGYHCPEQKNAAKKHKHRKNILLTSQQGQALDINQREKEDKWKWELLPSRNLPWHSNLFNIQRAAVMGLKEKNLLFKSSFYPSVLPCASLSGAISSFST